MSFENIMENIKIENTSRYEFLKHQVDSWTNVLGQVENDLVLKPDSFFYKCIKIQAKACLRESIENLNEYLFKYGK